MNTLLKIVIFFLGVVSYFGYAAEQTGVPTRRQDNSRSCLNYGHSCWGAHGKRSNDIGKEKMFEKQSAGILKPEEEEWNAEKVFEGVPTPDPMISNDEWGEDNGPDRNGFTDGGVYDDRLHLTKNGILAKELSKRKLQKLYKLLGILARDIEFKQKKKSEADYVINE